MSNEILDSDFSTHLLNCRCCCVVWLLLITSGLLPSRKYAIIVFRLCFSVAQITFKVFFLYVCGEYSTYWYCPLFWGFDFVVAPPPLLFFEDATLSRTNTKTSSSRQKQQINTNEFRWKNIVSCDAATLMSWNNWVCFCMPYNMGDIYTLCMYASYTYVWVLENYFS